MKQSFTRLTLPARVDSGAEFRAFIHDGAKSAGLGVEDLNRLDLVMEEILVNIARYAYAPGSGDTEVAYAVDGKSLLVEISDQGHSFNPLEAAAPDLTLGLADRPIGGLGVPLVKQIVGSLTYQRVSGRNVISFRFPGRASG